MPATLPVRRDAGAGDDPADWTPAFALLAVAGAAGGLWLWRLAARGTGGQRLARRQEADVARLSSQTLTQHASVHCVQWHGEEYLLGCTSQQVTLLSRRPVGAGDGTEG